MYAKYLSKKHLGVFPIPFYQNGPKAPNSPTLYAKCGMEQFPITQRHWKSFLTPKTSAIDQNADNKDVSKQKCVK